MPNGREPYPWKILIVLVASGIFGMLCVLPYLDSLLRGRLPPLPFSTPTLLVIQAAQGAVLLTLAAALGLQLARKTGFRFPLLESWLLRRQQAIRPWIVLRDGIAAGAFVGAAIVILARLVFAPRMPALPSEAEIEIWKRFLAAFYGAIDEEIFLRLFLMSLVVWLLSTIMRRPVGIPTATIIWVSNLATAIVFGLGHLPTASFSARLTPTLILYVLILNGIAGITFGYLYWKRGFEAAMVSHFAADLVLHVLGPFLKR